MGSEMCIRDRGNTLEDDKNPPLLKMVNISKRFGAVQALKRVSLTLHRGEVLGLVGDNGAGKSTLIKILVGIYPPDEGEIYFEGKKVLFSSPLEARMAGIETVHQNLALVDIMSVMRNFYLGREIYKGGPFRFLCKKRMSEECMKRLSEIGIHIRSPEEPVSVLSGGERQAIAIARAIHFGAKLLVLDEPTAFLSVKETRKVQDIVMDAKKRQISCIFITHNIWHVYEVADKFMILNRGVKLGEFYKEDVTPDDIAEIIAKGYIPSRLERFQIKEEL